jgi:hypothetical protein
MDHLDNPKFNPPTLAEVVWDMVDAVALIAELAIGGELARRDIEALDRLLGKLEGAATRSGMPDIASHQKRASDQLRLRFGQER